MGFFMKTKHWLAFITLGLIWGSSFLWIKIAVSEISPILLVALRLLFGILGSVVVVLIARPVFPKERKLWLVLTLIGFTNNALPYVLISWGEQYIDSAVAAILNSTTPLFTMIIAHFFLHDDRLSGTLGVADWVCRIVVLMSRDLEPGFWDQSVITIGQLAVYWPRLRGYFGLRPAHDEGFVTDHPGFVPLLGGCRAVGVGGDQRIASPNARFADHLGGDHLAGGHGGMRGFPALLLPAAFGRTNADGAGDLCLSAGGRGAGGALLEGDDRFTFIGRWRDGGGQHRAGEPE
jgi:hypothetical protein